MKKNKNVFFVCLFFIYILTFLESCSSLILFDPKGPIGQEERFVILTAMGLMMLVVIPVFLMAFWFTYKYRASNTKAKYTPNWSQSALIEFFMWGVPFVIVSILAYLAWTRTYALDPYKPIPSIEIPINVEAVSLDWKWLFIYPDYNIATVNEIAFPAKVPISFKITSETVMTSFFIPQLGSQMYAMAGMQTRLNLLADESGVYAGQNQQLSGYGFSDMHFKAKAMSKDEFQSWIQSVKQSSKNLDLTGYEELAKPNNTYYPITYYSSVKTDLFKSIIRKFDPMWDESHEQMSRDSHPGHIMPDASPNTSPNTTPNTMEER